nr:hypothetical protein [Tanacetum cinerariifolium]
PSLPFVSERIQHNVNGEAENEVTTRINSA